MNTRRSTSTILNGLNITKNAVHSIGDIAVSTAIGVHPQGITPPYVISWYALLKSTLDMTYALSALTEDSPTEKGLKVLKANGTMVGAARGARDISAVLIVLSNACLWLGGLQSALNENITGLSFNLYLWFAICSLTRFLMIFSAALGVAIVATAPDVNRLGEHLMNELKVKKAEYSSNSLVALCATVGWFILFASNPDTVGALFLAGAGCIGFSGLFDVATKIKQPTETSANNQPRFA